MRVLKTLVCVFMCNSFYGVYVWHIHVFSVHAVLTNGHSTAVCVKKQINVTVELLGGGTMNTETIRCLCMQRFKKHMIKYDIINAKKSLHVAS